MNTVNKVIAEKIWSIPYSKEFFLALGYEPVEEGKMKFSESDFSVIKPILDNIHEYIEKYEQIPEETLIHMEKTAEEEKKRKERIDMLERQVELDRKDKSKDFVPAGTKAKDLKFGATEIVCKAPPGGK